MDPRASGGVHIIRDLLGMPASPAVGATIALQLISVLVNLYGG
jgi:hypothetical protein